MENDPFIDYVPMINGAFPYNLSYKSSGLTRSYPTEKTTDPVNFVSQLS